MEVLSFKEARNSDVKVLNNKIGWNIDLVNELVYIYLRYEKRKKIVRIKHDITCFIESLFCLNTNLINKINNSLIFKDITKKL